MRASVVLPQPDSPTSASTSPSRTSRSTPSTARATAPFARREAHLEPADLEQRRRSPCVARRPSSDADAGRAAVRSSTCQSSTSSSRALRPAPRAQRGWNGHPDGQRRAGRAGRRRARTGAMRYAWSPIIGNAADERLRVRVRRRRRNTSALGPFLDDPARVHDREPPADAGERREVVGDEHHRQPEVPLQLLEQLEHLRLHHHVERGRRLVGDQQARVARERERDQHPLASDRPTAGAGSRRRGRAGSPTCSSSSRHACAQPRVPEPTAGAARSPPRSASRPSAPG